MDLPDLEIIKLQYEILNISVESICSSSGLNPLIFPDIIKKHGWKRWWKDPEEPEAEIVHDGDPRVDEFGEDLLTIQSEAYVDRTKKRLAAYALAKQVLLAQKYLELESKLISKALESIRDIDTSNTAGIKALSSLYKDLTKGSSLDGAFSVGVGQNDDGLPQLIVRDLSGS